MCTYRCSSKAAGLLLLMGSTSSQSTPCSPRPMATAVYEVDATGLYLDRPSYEIGDTISIFANWPNESDVMYRVTRRGPAGPSEAGPEDWTQAYFPSGPMDMHPYGEAQVAPFGSFVQFPGNAPDLSGHDAFTLEGWVYPSYTTGHTGEDGDWVNICGQMELDTGGPWPEPGTKLEGIAGIGISPTGHLFGMSRTVGAAPYPDLVLENEALPCQTWSYVALTYDGTKLRLYRAVDGECLKRVAETTTFGSQLQTGSTEFRLGARAEAPGDRTGCLDGRLDRWGVWTEQLGAAKLRSQMQGGEDAPGSCTRIAPDPTADGLVLYLGFGEHYNPVGPNFPLPTYIPVGPNGILTDWDAEIFNYGRPGVSGRPKNGRAVHLQHDQVIDARFDVIEHGETGTATVATLDTGNFSVNDSGLYAVQAVFSRGGTNDPWHPDNTKANHFASFVLRKAPQAPMAGVAVIVPVFTRQVYNAWPGANADDALGGATAKDLSARRITDPGDPTKFFYIPQGNNSAYGQCGDGVSPVYISSWRRPNVLGSPKEAFGFAEPDYSVNGSYAVMDSRFFEWLEGPPAGSEVLNCQIEYDTYADYDLHEGTLNLVNASNQPEYQLVMLMAKPEYFSGDMLDKVEEYMASGGNLLCVGGNSLARRAEPGFLDDVAPSTGDKNRLLEVRKWPCTNAVDLLGDYDAYHWFGTQAGPAAKVLSGSWRYLEVCEGRESYKILGTVSDGVGGFCKTTANYYSDFGEWEVKDDTHSLMAGHFTNGDILTSGTVVGPEADAYALYDGMGVIPVLSPFIYSITGPMAGVNVLASGANFFGGMSTCADPMKVLRWDEGAIPGSVLIYPPSSLCDAGNVDPLGGGKTCAVISTPTGRDGHGNIVHYHHDSGGQVLNVASIYSPKGLNQGTDLSDIVIRYINSFFACPASHIGMTPRSAPVSMRASSAKGSGLEAGKTVARGVRPETE